MTMAFRSWSCAAVAMIISTVLYIVSLSTNYWDNNDDSHKGLWSVCDRGGANTAGTSGGGCRDVNADGHLNAVRVLTIIAAAAAALSALMYLNAIYIETKFGGYSAESFAFLSGILGLIAMIIYSSVNHRGNYGYSFALQVVSWILALLTGTSLCASVLY